MSLVFQSFLFTLVFVASFLFAMEEIVKPTACSRQEFGNQVQRKLVLNVFGYARDLPAVVLAVQFVGEEIKLRLQ